MSVLEKILEEIEKEQNSYEADHAWNYSKGLEDAKEIIRSHMDVGKDINILTNGWIPVSERLPELDKEILAQWELYDRYNDMTYVYIDKLWINKMTGEWNGALGVPRGNVIAWQPLPEQCKGDCDEKRKI